ncbi:MAG: DUF5715 family protein [Clostridium sp.]|nr:DUF5715 family protein [Prevotella sp.]MCM1429004.1 DUF5715 family protein [Clostridium sp.]MCM1475466.1 DUF5715 family protein [Muribaculaceae bacterium]
MKNIYIIAAMVLLAACGSSKKDIDTPCTPREVVEKIEMEKPRDDWKIVAGPRHNDRIRINPMDSALALVFNDSNYRQYAFAEKLGIDPISDIGGAYFTKRPLVKITTNKYYFVDPLTHSVPYLVPEAAALLHHLGVAFIDSLGSRGADGYLIRVTSLLRTRQSVKSLRRVNRNATDSSTHQFGTTFDLSWSRFHCLDSTRTLNQEDLKNLLAEVLEDARKEGRCLVKYERKTCCFHITATK